MKLRVFVLLFALINAPYLNAETVGNPSGTFVNLSAQANEEVKLACDAAFAARLSLASMYGNCDAPSAAKGGGVPADSMCQSMPSKQPGSLADIWKQGGQCPKGSSKKPEYCQTSARVKISGDTVDPLPGGCTDCSGFFSGVEARLGHRLIPGKDMTEPTSTAELVKTLGQSNSCYRMVTTYLLPGDVVFYNDGDKGHVSMIDRISSGGIGSCEFSIIESSGGSDHEYGGPRVVVKGGKSGGSVVSDRMGSAMNSMAKSCVAREGKDVKVARFDSKKPGCQGPVKKFKNEECVKKCPDLGRSSEI